jgi:hypothetical protein
MMEDEYRIQNSESSIQHPCGRQAASGINNSRGSQPAALLLFILMK